MPDSAGASTRPAPTPELLDKLARCASATLTSELYRMGYRNTYMQGVGAVAPGQKAFGPAHTLRYLPFREDVGNRLATPAAREENRQRQAIESVPTGAIFVVDARGRADAGILGDVLLARVRARGAAGLVTDGAVRDVAAIRAMEFPVFCQGSHGAVSNTIHWASDFGQPVQCGGVLVLPGDLILADDDGVVVIPLDAAAEAIDKAIEHEAMDEFSREKVEAGQPITAAYPPNADLMAEYRARRSGA